MTASPARRACDTGAVWRPIVVVVLGCGGCSGAEPCDVGSLCLEAHAVPLRAASEVLAIADVDVDGRLDLVAAAMPSAGMVATFDFAGGRRAQAASDRVEVLVSARRRGDRHRRRRAH